jgi:hypothetical protein
MLDKNFTPPSQEVSAIETKKRLDLIEKVRPALSEFAVAVMVSGSMGYGQNYSVTEKSDIDTQILLTKETAPKILSSGLFDKEKLGPSIEGYLHGVAQQFSFSTPIDGISLECHFWDKDAFIAAATLKTESTVRLRSSLTPPSVDYGYSFDGSEDKVELPGEQSGSYILGTFPSFRRRDNKIFLCRPITNMLGNPFIVQGGEILNPLIAETWRLVIQELIKVAPSPVDLDAYNVFNALPGKQKASPAVKALIKEKTIAELKRQDAARELL